MASVFDPLGWASPIVLLAKLLLRQLWDDEMKWDEEVHLRLQEEWEDISGYLDEVQKIELPRQMFPLNNGDGSTFYLHAFVDASALAFAVVIYLVQQSNGENRAAFVASKSRLAPKKKITIPKLELLAVQIGVRYINFVEQALQLQSNVNKIIWSDSKCVLAWVHSKKMLPAIIQKHITTIKKQEITEFRYVPSADNKADVATRGMTLNQLREIDWWQTPKWLFQRQAWPENEIAAETEKEVQLIINDVTQEHPANKQKPDSEKKGVFQINIKNFSSLHKLLRVTSLVMEAAKLFSKRRSLEIAKTDSYELARKLWIKWDQKRNHLSLLTTAGRLPTIEDEDGLVRCTTRIPAQSYQEAATPLLLANNSRLTHLIILHIHEYNHHAGSSHILAILRKNYYLQKARREIYHVIKTRCYKCRRHVIKEYTVPEPALLPASRIEMSATLFEAIGMDVFGPFNVRLHEINKTPKQKRWVVIYTCATIRAVHLEVIEDMTTKELLWAFRRFAARRGVPAKIICDNAPQFGALDHKFQDVWKAFATQDQVTNYFAP